MRLDIAYIYHELRVVYSLIVTMQVFKIDDIFIANYPFLPILKGLSIPQSLRPTPHP